MSDISIGNNYGMVLISVPPADAETIASALVEKKLAACAQIVEDMTSVYWWQGELERDKEKLVLGKTKRSLFEDIEALLDTIHPYDVPEILFLPIGNANRSYIEWMDEVLEE